MRRDGGTSVVVVLAFLAIPWNGPSQTPLSPVDEAMNLGEALQKKGDYAGALERFQWCASSARQLADEKRLSVCQQLTGAVQRLLGDYVAAEAQYREALTHAAGDPGRESYILNNLASLFGAQGRYNEAISILRRCLEINAKAGVVDDAAPWQNLAISYALQGDHARALETFLGALRIYERLGAKSKIALVHHNMGVLQMKQGNYAAAKRELLDARARAEITGDQNVIAQSLADLGRLEELEGHSAQALESITAGLALCRGMAFKACIGEGELNLGNLHLAHGRLEAATAAFVRAREILESLHDSYYLGQTLRGLGYVARLRGEFSAGKGYASQALDLARGIGDPDGEWQSQALLGLIAGDAGERTQAREAWQSAIDVIEKQRGQVGGGEEEQQRFFEKAVYPYRELALLEALDHQPLAALRAAEKARSRVLLDMIASGTEKIGAAMTETERAEETRLTAAIAGVNARMGRVGAAGKEALLARQTAAWADYETFRAALYVAHPALRTWRGESPVIGETELAALLPDSKTALIEFICTREQTLLFVATRGAAGSAGPAKIEVFPLAIPRAALTARAERYRSLLEQRDPGFRAEARALFRTLLEPAAAALRGKTKIHLAADGPLWELPFQTLVDGAGRYWVETVTLGWLPSLTFLRDQSRLAIDRPTSLELVAFADPPIAGAPGIPVLRTQVARIAALYDPGKTAVRVGQEAGEGAFRELAPRAKVIHLATHGIADRENAMRSRVLLTPSSESDTSADGWLEAWELMRLDLHADVVVLSACETGRGHITEGEGLVGLTWALFVAGARNVVVSQWRVESQSTTELMAGLHRGLRRGERPAEALRAAVLTLMKDPRYRHPYYWGAFLAAGN